MMQMPNTQPDFRAFLAQLVDRIDREYAPQYQGKEFTAELCEAIEQARAALAAEQQGPSDEELMATYWEGAGLDGVGTGAHILRGLRAVLARYGGQP